MSISPALGRPIDLAIAATTALTTAEVTDFVIVNRHVPKGDTHAATWVPLPQRIDGGLYLGASRQKHFFHPPSRAFEDLGGAIVPGDVFDRHEEALGLLGGRKRVKKILDPVKADYAIAFFAVTRRGEEVTEVSLLLPYFGPLAAKFFVKSEHLDDPIDVVWRPDFGVDLSDALDAARESILAVPKPKKEVREAYGYHPLERGSVLAALHGTPVEWARAFLDGEA